MRFVFGAVCAVALTGCMDAEPADTPDRSIRSFNGTSVVIQSKGSTPNAADIALAKTACPGATYQTTVSTIPSDLIGVTVSDYLFICK